MIRRFVMALMLVWPGIVWADEVTAPVAAGVVTQPVAEPAATAVQDAASDFDPFLIPVVDQKAADEGERLRTRRTYLKVHQAAGLTALTLLIGQVSLGQYLMWRKDCNLFGEKYDKYREVHKYLGITTFTVYSVAAGAAILAPKVDRDGEFDTITVHKSLALVHGTGMAIMPFLGYYMVGEAERGASPKRIETLNKTHQIIGYSTATALAGAFVAITW